MELIIKLSQFLLSLSLLIILHELGHFIPAKLFKTRVEKFYLFFDVKFSLFKKKIGDTVYGIGWLPLGGYVKIAGMIDESMDTDQMQQEPQPWEFRSKPAWQRLIIMLGGVTVNFVLAFVIYIGMAYVYGESYLKNEDIIDGVYITNPVLQNAGLQTGDKIISIDGKVIERFNDLPEALLVGVGKDVVLERNGIQKTITLPMDLIGQVVDGSSMSLVSLRMPFVVASVSEESANLNTLKPKDVILDINGESLRYFDQAEARLSALKGQTVPAEVLRDGKNTPVKLAVDADGKLGVGVGMVGIQDMERMGYYTISHDKYSFLEAIPVGLVKGKDKVVGYWAQLKLMVSPETGAYKGVGGFKAIFDIFPQFWSWELFWSITAILSIMLGVMNLLPIPALDGGHVMFLLYEMISGRKPSDKFMENAQMVGFFILIGLLLFANGNDIYKAILGK